MPSPLSGLRRRLISLFRNMVQPRTVSHRGVIIPATNAAISKKIRRSIYEGGYEAKECDLLAATLEENDRVLELGAGVGFLGAFCALRLRDSGRVCCVEANPALAAVASETFLLNHVTPRYIQAAAADSDGVAELFTTDDFWAASTVISRGRGDVVAVPAIALSRLIADFCPSFIVCDIEGAECNVLRCSLGSVRKLCIEIHPHVTGSEPINELVSDLRSQGFYVEYSLSTNAVLYLVRP